MRKIKIGSYEFYDYEDERNAQLETWQLESGNGNGMVFTSDKIIGNSESPLFEALIGQNIRTLPPTFKVTWIREIESVAERNKLDRARNRQGRNPLDDMEMWVVEGPEGSGAVKTRGGLIKECDSVLGDLKHKDIAYLPAEYKIKYLGTDPYR